MLSKIEAHTIQAITNGIVQVHDCFYVLIKYILVFEFDYNSFVLELSNSVPFLIRIRPFRHLFCLLNNSFKN